MEIFRRTREAPVPPELKRARNIAEGYLKKGEKFVKNTGIDEFLGLYGNEISYTTLLVGRKLLQLDIRHYQNLLRKYDESRLKFPGIPSFIDPAARNRKRLDSLLTAEHMYDFSLDTVGEDVNMDEQSRHFTWTANLAVNDLFTRLFHHEGRKKAWTDQDTTTIAAWSVKWSGRLSGPAVPQLPSSDILTT